MKASILYRTPVALAVALAMAATVYPTFAQAKGDSTSAATAQSGTTAQAPSSSGQAKQPQLSKQDRDVMKPSDDGFATMRAVRAARISIFEGNPNAAHDMVAAAESSLKAAAKDATTLRTDQKSDANQPAGTAKAIDDAGYVPIDGQITLVDSFIDSPAKKGHVDRANENIAKGKSKEALDELKLAEVDASFTRVLMPLQATQKHVDAAAKLIDQKKFYEANLALKAAEDGLILDSVALSETPNANANAPAKPAAPNTAGTTPKG